MAEAAAAAAGEFEERRRRDAEAKAAAARASADSHAAAAAAEAAREERRRQRRQQQPQQQQQQQTASAAAPEPSPAASSSMLEVTVPAGFKAGDTMQVALEDGSSFEVVVPDGCHEGASFLVEPPEEEIEEEDIPSGTERQLVTVPEGVRPGETFNVSTSWGGVFEVECPAGVAAGEVMEVELPVEPETEYPELAAQPAASIGDRGQIDGSSVRRPNLPSIDDAPRSPGTEDEDAETEALLDRTALKQRSLAILDSAVQLGKAVDTARAAEDDTQVRAAPRKSRAEGRPRRRIARTAACNFLAFGLGFGFVMVLGWLSMALDNS